MRIARRRRGPLAPIGLTIGGMLVLALAIAAAVTIVGLHYLHVRQFKPEPQLSAATLYDLLKIAFAVAAGIGGIIALVTAYRRQRIAELAEQREGTRLFNERFATAAGQLGDDKPAVRLAGVYAMAGLADDWPQQRQTCVDVLCAFLRMPYQPAPGNDASAAEQQAFRAGREVRHTVMRVITAHLHPDNYRAATVQDWRGLNFDFTGAVFDGGQFNDAEFTGGTVNFYTARFIGGTVNFNNCRFAGGEVYFGDTEFTGGTVDFEGAQFSEGTVSFGDAKFTGGTVSFRRAGFTGGTVSFADTEVTGGAVNFENAQFTGGKVRFGRTNKIGTVSFDRVAFTGGTVSFDHAEFTGGRVSFGAAQFTGSAVSFVAAGFAGGTVSFDHAGFAGGTVIFVRAGFGGGTVSFDQAEFAGGTVSFGGAGFAGGTVYFGALFPGGTVRFVGAHFTGRPVDFRDAHFTGSTVDFSGADWLVPPRLPTWDHPPTGVTLPASSTGPADVSGV